MLKLSIFEAVDAQNNSNKGDRQHGFFGRSTNRQQRGLTEITIGRHHSTTQVQEITASKRVICKLCANLKLRHWLRLAKRTIQTTDNQLGDWCRAGFFHATP